MKLCIYQLAFIAVIVCFSKALHPKHEHLPAKVSGHHLYDLIEQIHSAGQEFIEEADKVEKLHDHISGNVDRNEKKIDGKTRSARTKAHHESGNALVRKEQQIQKTHHHLEKTLEQLKSGLNLLKDGNQRTINALNGIPASKPIKENAKGYKKDKNKRDYPIAFSN